MQFDPAFAVIASLILSYVLVSASLHKWRNIEDFRETLINYQVLPEGFSGALVYSIPAVEMLTGMGLLLPASAHMAALATASLLLMYMGAMGINLVRGRRSIDCGCGGSEQKQAISEWLLLRNGILLLLVYCIMVPVQAREFVWFDWLVIALASVSACLIYNIVNQLLINRELLQVFSSDHG